MFIKELKNFILHLRINYNILILSSSFLLGGLFSDNLNVTQFIIQYLNIHILLFGGINAYNSFCDKDKGPIGGLKHPPKMKPWIHSASFIIQLIGFFLTLLVNNIGYSVMYAFAILIGWMYSSPHVRLKSHPIISLITISLSNGPITFYMGLICAGSTVISPSTILPALGLALLIASFYPISQIYQIKEDAKKGDKTFAVTYGIKNLTRLYLVSFSIGTILITASLILIQQIIGIIFFILAIVPGIVSYFIVSKLKGRKSEYSIIMKLKYVSGLLFSFLILILLFIV